MGLPKTQQEYMLFPGIEICKKTEMLFFHNGNLPAPEWMLSADGSDDVDL